ncbi:MAG: hypothetical protein ACLRSW_06715 [Christensenellaceae bacterium]
MGEDERIDVVPHCAVTAEVAYQYFEENETGTLSEGSGKSDNPQRKPRRLVRRKLREIRWKRRYGTERPCSNSEKRA